MELSNLRAEIEVHLQKVTAQGEQLSRERGWRERAEAGWRTAQEERREATAKLASFGATLQEAEAERDVVAASVAEATERANAADAALQARDAAATAEVKFASQYFWKGIGQKWMLLPTMMRLLMVFTPHSR